MFCKKCGNKLTEDDIFCPICGCKNASLDQNNTMEGNCGIVNKQVDNSFFKENRKQIIVVSCVFLIGLSILAINSYQNYQDNKLWREYKSVQTSGVDFGSSSYGGIDYTNLHKYCNSTYKIGTDMPAGEYVLFAISDSGYFCLSSDSTGNSIICNDNFDYNSIISVKEGEYLELSRCYAEPISSAGTISTSGSGMFKIGKHLSAGEYKLEATGSSGYYCVYGDDRQDDIVNNDNFEGTAYVSVREGQYLLLSRCKIVK